MIVFIKKRCSENMQQIYRRIPMLKCDFNKVASQLLLVMWENKTMEFLGQFPPGQLPPRTIPT